ncbi:MAG: type II toxin-antitoxin system VapB family antitoxin [Pseudomonadota bacterium]
MSKHIAKIFTIGGSQAIRLPKEFRFETEQVSIRKSGDDLIISAIKLNWDDFFDQSSAFGNDFLAERDENTRAQERDSL